MFKFTGMVASLLLAATAFAHAQTTKLVIGGDPIVEVPQYVVAMKKGLFEEQGLEIQSVPFATGREGFEALIGGQLDMVIMAEFPAVVGAMRDREFGIVSLFSRYKGTRIVVSGDEAPKTAADLKGKKIGVTIGTNSHYMVDRELQRAGVTAEFVNVAPADLVPAIVRGDIEAAAPFPAFYPAAQRNLGDKYQALKVDSYGTTFILAATRKLIDENPEAIEKVLTAMLKGEKDMEANLPATQEMIAQATNGAQRLEDIRANWNDFDYRLTLDQAFVDVMLDEGKWIAEQGLIKGVEPTAEMFRAVIWDAGLKKVDPSRMTLAD